MSLTKADVDKISHSTRSRGIAPGSQHGVAHFDGEGCSLKQLKPLIHLLEKAVIAWAVNASLISVANNVARQSAKKISEVL